MIKLIIQKKQAPLSPIILRTKIIEPTLITHYGLSNFHPHSTFSALRLKHYYQIQELLASKNVTSISSEIDSIIINDKEYPIKKSFNYHAVKMLFDNIKENNYLTCSYCRKILQHKELTIDHYIPKCDGGSDEAGNLKVSCHNCNRLKSAINPINDTKLFNHFLEYIRPSTSSKHVHFLKFLLKNKKYTSNDYNLLLDKLSLPIEARIELLFKMSLVKAPFTVRRNFNLEKMKESLVLNKKTIYQFQHIERIYYK